MFLDSVHQRLSAAIENPEVADERLQRRDIAGGRDHRGDAKPRSVGEDRRFVLEAVEQYGCGFR